MTMTDSAVILNTNQRYDIMDLIDIVDRQLKYLNA